MRAKLAAQMAWREFISGWTRMEILVWLGLMTVGFGLWYIADRMDEAGAMAGGRCAAGLVWVETSSEPCLVDGPCISAVSGSCEAP